MSWTQVIDPYGEFEQLAANTPVTIPQSQWTIDIWEVTHDCPDGDWWRYEVGVKRLETRARLRVVFAPLDLPQRDAVPQMVNLFKILSIPGCFTTERLHSVSHSFGTSTDSTGYSSWFHFLCKNIEIARDELGRPIVDNRAARLGHHSSTAAALPQADYSWHRSGFFLRTNANGDTTLVCFGATPRVRMRLHNFIEGKAWADVHIEPTILFDLILDGLFLEVDDTVWNMNTVFGPLEHQILQYANSKNVRKMSKKINFVALHNCAKHIIHIAEAIDSCIMVVDGAKSGLDPERKRLPDTENPDKDMVLAQLKECLQYRRSLFKSSKLRLTSLQKRIENAITLSFNLVTQQDSMLMVQDSTSMKIIAVITMIFLPTTGVAAIVGSQLFLSNLDETDGLWNIACTPLFKWLWWISIPLTISVLLLSWAWHWWAHHDDPNKAVVQVVHGLRRAATFRSTSSTVKA